MPFLHIDAAAVDTIAKRNRATGSISQLFAIEDNYQNIHIIRRLLLSFTHTHSCSQSNGGLCG